MVKKLLGQIYYDIKIFGLEFWRCKILWSPIFWEVIILGDLKFFLDQRDFEFCGAKQNWFKKNERVGAQKLSLFLLRRVKQFV